MTTASTLHPAQVLDLAARCGLLKHLSGVSAEKALLEFAALVRDAEPLAPDEMRPAVVAEPEVEAAPERADIIGYVEPGPLQGLRENQREGCYIKLYAVPFSEASARPTVPLYASTSPPVAPASPAPPLMRQAVASVVSRAGVDLRIGWLRPERCEVGDLLYVVDRAALNPPTNPKE